MLDLGPIWIGLFLRIVNKLIIHKFVNIVDEKKTAYVDAATSFVRLFKKTNVCFFGIF